MKRFCGNCGQELEGNIAFCPVCGTKVEAPMAMNDPKNTSPSTANSKKNKNKKWIIVLICVLLLVGSVAVIGTIHLLNQDDETVEEKDKEKEKDKEETPEDDSDEEKDEELEDPEKDSEEDIPSEEETPFSGTLTLFSEDRAWMYNNQYLYLINSNGRILYKKDVSDLHIGLTALSLTNFDDGYALINNTKTIVDKNGIEITLTDSYSDMKYVGDGFLVVETKDSDYKGTVTKKGIYDLEKRTYNLALAENISSIKYLGDEMFYITYTSTQSKDRIYDADARTSFEFTYRSDTLKTEYDDDYIIFQDTNADNAYAMDRRGKMTLIATNCRHAMFGELSDGLIYIKDAFYDMKGKKVIDLNGEGVSNQPVMINGYALVFFKTGYFTILNRNGDYMFEPKSYIEMGSVYTGSATFGIYKD